MIQVNIKFFGPLRDVVQCDELSLELPPSSTGEMAFEQLATRYAQLRQWKPSVRLAVNMEYSSFDRVLNADDEVCFVPPVSGG